jgi:hypothetical protein
MAHLDGKDLLRPHRLEINRLSRPLRHGTYFHLTSAIPHNELLCALPIPKRIALMACVMKGRDWRRLVDAECLAEYLD